MMNYLDTFISRPNWESDECPLRNSFFSKIYYPTLAGINTLNNNRPVIFIFMPVAGRMVSDY